MLEIKNLKLNLKDIVIDIPHLRVENGDYLAIMGMTGAGKTVLMETLAGFHRPDEGEIYLDGKRIEKLSPDKRGIAMVYQDFMLFPHMKVRENIEYGLRVRKIRDLSIVEQIAEKLEISGILKRYPRNLSGGEKQRVAIARAIVTKPKILLMDEPFSSLDVKTRENIRKLVKKVVNDLKITVIHVTHDFEDVFVLANRVVIMKDGKILQAGTVDNVFRKPTNEFIANFVSTNVLKCRVVGKKGNLSILDCNGVNLYTSDKSHGSVIISIRPEEIIVSPEKIFSSARNILRGKIIDVIRHGNLVWLTVDAGIKLRTVITPNSMELLGIEKNKDVYVIFKASCVRVIG